MYTQCPECHSVYRVTSAHLRLAGGEVQCGTCGARFDALDRLSDTYPRGPAAPGAATLVPGAAGIAVPPATAEDTLPEEERGPDGESLSAAVPSEEKPTPGESADEAGAGSAEPGAPVGEIAAELADTGEAPSTADVPDDEPTEPALKETGEDQEAVSGSDDEPTEPALSVTEEDQDTITASDSDDEPTEPDLAETELGETGNWQVLSDEETPPGAGTEFDGEPTVDLDLSVEDLFALEELHGQQLPDVGDLEFVEGLPSRQAKDDTAAETPPGELVTRRPSAVLRWLRRLALVLVLAALAAAVVHSQRGVLMTRPAVAPWLEKIYDRLGVVVAPAWDVAAYRIIDSSAEVDARGDLQVGLSFVNGADFPQPYPILRISLEDRWGDEIGSRQLAPGEYVPGSVAGRMMTPGRRMQGQASVSPVPGAAVGFRLDLCLPAADGALACSSAQP